MVKTIGNPLTWTANAVSATGEAIVHGGEHLGGDHMAPPRIRELTNDDIRFALRAGWEDFKAMRSDVMAIVMLYPVIGVVTALLAFHANMAHYIFPVAAGFALISPVAAIGLYELSRKREVDGHANWGDALAVLGSPAITPILVLGLYLLAIFIIWMVAANLVFAATLGTAPYPTIQAFVSDLFNTSQGLWMIIIGMLVGCVFAGIVLMVSIVSFPLLLHRNVGLPTAVMTSIKVSEKSPRVVATWGLIVASLLLLGSIPLFLGLIVAFPLLGHATWHLYRRAVV